MNPIVVYLIMSISVFIFVSIYDGFEGVSLTDLGYPGRAVACALLSPLFVIVVIWQMFYTLGRYLKNRRAES